MNCSNIANNSTFKLATNEIKENSGKDVVDCRFNKNNNNIKVNIKVNN